MSDTPGRPKLLLHELDPYGLVLELRCWSEEEARDLYQRMELRGRGFALTYVDAAGKSMGWKQGER